MEKIWIVLPIKRILQICGFFVTSNDQAIQYIVKYIAIYILAMWPLFAKLMKV